MSGEKDEKFRELLELEGECPINAPYTHRWIGLEWLDSSRVWVRRCGACGAREVWRGNDTIFYRVAGQGRILFIFHDRHEFTETREKAVEMLAQIEVW
jgi:hypothetical protein